MDLSTASPAVTVIAAVFILVGIAGVVVPMLPGLVLSWIGVLIWAIFAEGGSTKWIVFAVVSALALLGLLVKYAIPGRRMKKSGVPTRSIVAGAVFGIIGFFVIPIAGLVIGFVFGVFLAEWVRLDTPKQAWPSTKSALKAVGLALIIELFAALTIGVTWTVGLFVV